MEIVPVVAVVLAGAATVAGIVSLVVTRRRTGIAARGGAVIGTGIAGVVVCTVLLRALQYALRLTFAGIMQISGGGAGITWLATTAQSQDAVRAFTAANAVHPLTMWPGRLWVGTDAAALRTAVLAVAVITVLVSGALLYAAGRRWVRGRPGR